MVTIKDIAKKAGVSVTTVSMTLNNKGNISKATRNKVMKIAESMNYQPNKAAQSLKTKKSYIISIIVGDISNPYFVDIIKGFEKKAREDGYEIILSNCGRDAQRSVSQLKALESRGVDGIYFSWAGGYNKELSSQILKMKRQGMPIILSREDTIKHIKFPIVDYDIADSLKMALQYLLELGHRKIGFIGGYPNYKISIDNLNYYKEMMKEKGIYNSKFVEFGYYEIEEGKKAAHKLLSRKNRPTAIQATTDLMAVGILSAAKELNIKVPEELSVMGFDNIPYTKYTDPAINTVKINKNEIGFYAAENLIKKIENPDYQIPRKYLIPTELIIRESCKRK